MDEGEEEREEVIIRSVVGVSLMWGSYVDVLDVLIEVPHYGIGRLWRVSDVEMCPYQGLPLGWREPETGSYMYMG